MVMWTGLLKVKTGKREEYLSKIIEAGLIEKFLNHPGNVFYRIGLSVTDDNAIIVCDAWETKENFTAHDTSADVDIWREIYAEYVESCDSVLME